MSVFNSIAGTGVPGPFHGEDVKTLLPTVNGFPKEFFAERAEVVAPMKRGVEPPLADFAPTAVEGGVLVDCNVIAFSADCDLFLTGPAPIVAIPVENVGPCEVICFVHEIIEVCEFVVPVDSHMVINDTA